MSGGLERKFYQALRVAAAIGVMSGPVRAAHAQPLFSPTEDNRRPSAARQLSQAEAEEIFGCTLGPISQIGGQDLTPLTNASWAGDYQDGKYFDPNGIHGKKALYEYPSLDIFVQALTNIFPEGGVIRMLGSDSKGTGANGIVIEGLGKCSGMFMTAYHLDKLPDKVVGSVIQGSEILGNASCAGFENDCDPNGLKISPHIHLGFAFADPKMVPHGLKTYETIVNPAIFGVDKVYFVSIEELLQKAIESGHYLNMYETVWNAVHDAGGTDADAIFTFGTIISESGGTYCPQDGYWLNKFANDGIGGYPNNLCVSVAGAEGTGQFMPLTWQIQINLHPGLTREDIFDPYKSTQQTYLMLKRIGVIDALHAGDLELAKQLFSGTAPLNDTTMPYAVKDQNGNLVLPAWNLGQDGYDQVTRILAVIEGYNGVLPQFVDHTQPAPTLSPDQANWLQNTRWDEVIDFAQRTGNITTENANIVRDFLTKYSLQALIGLATFFGLGGWLGVKYLEKKILEKKLSKALYQSILARRKARRR